jgi:uncharacterized protein YndB with AHSA1/START domain
MFKIRVECVLDKRVEAVFDAIAAHANYKQFPGIDGSTLLAAGQHEKNGEGARREIVAGSFKFIERITRYERPSAMGYVIEHASPLPLRHDLGEITMHPVGNKTQVLWVSEGHIRIPIIGVLLDRVIEYQISKVFKAILQHIEVQESSESG